METNELENIESDIDTEQKNTVCNVAFAVNVCLIEKTMYLLNISIQKIDII